MITDILKRVDSMCVLPDAWIVTSAVPEGLARGMEPITAGDLRALVARVRELEAAAKDQRRGELLRVATTLLAAEGRHISETTSRAARAWAVDEAQLLIARIDEVK